MKTKFARQRIVTTITVLVLGLLVLGSVVALAADDGFLTVSNKSMSSSSMPSMDISSQESSKMPGMDMNDMNRNKGPVPVSSLPAAPMLTPTQMNGLVMPSGMIMTAGTSMAAMSDMAAVDITKIIYTAPVEARGDQVLNPKLENGVKVFNLNVSLIKWNILPGTQVAAYAFNRQVPGSRIHITEGNRVRFVLKNDLPEATSVHWHGLIVPDDMDGPANVTQQPIKPGASYTYEFTARQSGTYFYHSHKDSDRQQTLGMYGALIIDPKVKSNTPAYDKDVVVQLQEWTFKEGYTFPAMPMEGLLPNFFTINGKAYPSTETINAKVGEKIRFRFIGSNNSFIYPMHIHGGPFKIIETDGNPVPPKKNSDILAAHLFTPLVERRDINADEGAAKMSGFVVTLAAQIQKDTVNIGPGERYDVIWPAREQGKWLLHCHMPHHTTNDNVEEQGAGGLTMIINVT